jgi:hypothetical protein
MGGLRFRYSHWAFRLPLLRRYSAICLGRTILFKLPKEAISPRLLKHEYCHQDQIRRYGLLRFYSLYLMDYFKGLCRYRNHDQAYRHIRFEAEAFEKESESESEP